MVAHLVRVLICTGRGGQVGNSGGTLGAGGNGGRAWRSMLRSWKLTSTCWDRGGDRFPSPGEPGDLQQEVTVNQGNGLPDRTSAARRESGSDL